MAKRMAKILTYNSPPEVEKEKTKQSSFRSFFDWFSSQDRFTRYSILTLLLIIIATPFIVSQYLSYTPRAQTPQSLEEQAKEQTLNLLTLKKNNASESEQLAAASARKVILSQLISKNPRVIFDVDLTPKLRNPFSDSIKAQIEEQVEIDGKLGYIHSDDFENKSFKEQFYLDTADKRINVYFQSKKPYDLLWSQVKIKGLKIGDDLVVSNKKGVIKKIKDDKKVLPASTNKTLAVILFKFQNALSEPFTADQVRQRVFTAPDSLASYYREASNNVLTISPKINPNGDVFGWYTIPYDNTNCDYIGWFNAARNALKSTGTDPYSYDRLIYSFVVSSPCYQAQGATIGTSGGSEVYVIANDWIDGGFRTQTATHEIGHTLGAGHAGSYICINSSGQPVPISENCTTLNYGDPFDVMGSGFRHMNNFMKGRVHWYDQSNTQTVLSNGTYTVEVQERPTSGVKALRIPKDFGPGGAVSAYYYIEYRQPYGTFDNFSSTDPVVNGVSIRIADPYLGGVSNSKLLDMTPETPSSFWNSALFTDQTFTDPVRGISVRTVSLEPTSATVQITVPAFPDCLHQSPDVSIDPNTQWANPGETLQYTVSVTNNDSPACAPSSFNVSRGAGASSIFTFDPASFSQTISPGGTFTRSFTITSPPTLADGFYEFVYVVSNGFAESWGFGKYNVFSTALPPPPTPTITPTISPTPSPTIAPTSTPVPQDSDGDGFSDAVETFIGTNPTQKCQSAPNPTGITTPNTSWPPDLNGNNKVELADATSFIPHFNCVVGQSCYNQRFDLYPDNSNSINNSDVLKLIPTFNTNCN